MLQFAVSVDDNKQYTRVARNVEYWEGINMSKHLYMTLSLY
jgi:hypothetical protein